MSFVQLLGTLAALAVPASTGEVRVSFEAPELHVPGLPFVARVELAAHGDASFPAWYLGPAAFEVDGTPLGGEGARGADAQVALADGDALSLRLDLSRFLAVERGFQLTHAGLNPLAVEVLERAPEGTDFLALAPADLARFRVLLRTSRGDMLFELWPDVAPVHVANFLDLAQSGFYDGTRFHRVMAGFMIQGGDPEGTGNGNGPRTLRAEFSAKQHERGVLSMARTDDPHSASCQFFVMHADGPQLDGQYSVFGKLLRGFDTLDAIATAPGRYLSASGDVSPAEPQIIERAVAVLASPERN